MPTLTTEHTLCQNNTKSNRSNALISATLTSASFLREMPFDSATASALAVNPDALTAIVRSAPIAILLLASCSIQVTSWTFVRRRHSRVMSTSELPTRARMLASTSRGLPVTLDSIRSGDVTVIPCGPASASIRATSRSNSRHTLSLCIREDIIPSTTSQHSGTSEKSYAASSV